MALHHPDPRRQYHRVRNFPEASSAPGDPAPEIELRNWDIDDTPGVPAA